MSMKLFSFKMQIMKITRDLGFNFDILANIHSVTRNTLRVTRSAALSAQDGSVGGSVFLGRKGKDFEFSQLPMKVEFLECSARGNKGEDGDGNIESLETSLARL